MKPKIEDYRGKSLVRVVQNKKAVAASGYWYRPENLPFFENITAHVGRGRNVGLAVPEGMVVIDADIKDCKVGIASFAKLEKVCGEIPKTVLTPSRGFHCYVTIPKGLVLRDGLKEDYPDIDFQTFGRQVLIPGISIDGKIYSYHPESFMGCYDEEAASDALVADLLREKVVVVAEDDFSEI
jgi:hypothetical protein